MRYFNAFNVNPGNVFSSIWFKFIILFLLKFEQYYWNVYFLHINVWVDYHKTQYIF